jgi:hypothetical protein
MRFGAQTLEPNRSLDILDRQFVNLGEVLDAVAS